MSSFLFNKTVTKSTPLMLQDLSIISKYGGACIALVFANAIRDKYDPQIKFWRDLQNTRRTTEEANLLKNCLLHFEASDDYGPIFYNARQGFTFCTGASFLGTQFFINAIEIVQRSHWRSSIWSLWI